MKERDTKYVRRKLDFKMIEAKISGNSKVSETDKFVPDKEQSVNANSEIKVIDKLLSQSSAIKLKALEPSKTKPRKKKSCILCRSEDHTKPKCPFSQL